MSHYECQKLPSFCNQFQKLMYFKIHQNLFHVKSEWLVKFLNFHTMTIIYTMVVLEKIAFCPKMMIWFCEVCWMTDQLWKTQHSFCENAGFLSLEKCKDFLILIPIVPNHNSKISYWHSIHNLNLSLRYVLFKENLKRLNYLMKGSRTYQCP